MLRARSAAAEEPPDAERPALRRRGIPLHPRPVPVFGRRRRRARLPHRAGALRPAVAARRRLCRGRGLSRRGSAGRRPRSAPANCARRRNSPSRVHRLQPALCRAARRLGDLPRRGQPGRALQRLPGNRPARRRPPSTPSAIPCRASGGGVLSRPAAARRASGPAAATPSASSASATSRPTACARRRATCWARWSAAWRRSARLGRRHRDPALHGLRHPPVPRRRVRRARRRRRPG